MKLDSKIVGIAIEVGNKHLIPSERIIDIMEGYNKAIILRLKDTRDATSIKMDFIGKLIYSEQKVKKMQEIFEAKNSKQKLKKVKDKRGITLEEINGFKRRD